MADLVDGGDSAGHKTTAREKQTSQSDTGSEDGEQLTAAGPQRNEENWQRNHSYNAHRKG
jgi:hypothetical protein